MAKKAIYGKYECVERTYTEYVENLRTARLNTAASESDTTPVYRDYSFDKNTGLYTGSSYISGWNSTAALNANPCYIILQAQMGKMMRKFNNQYVADGGWTRMADIYTYDAKAETRYSYSKGSYLTDVIADYGTLPVDGKHTDGYWYVFLKMASDLKINDNGVWKDAPTGFVNVGGIWRPQSEFKTSINGIWK